MNILGTLHNLGLSENQSKVYLACLQLGRASVLQIAQYSNLKRPSVYLLLDDLQNQGLVTKTQTHNKTKYQAESPTLLIKKLEQQHSLATSILPSLQALYNVDPEKPTIKIAEGINGVRSVYNTIFDYMKIHKNEELLIFGALKDATYFFASEVIDYFYTTLGQTKNHIRELGNNDPETRKYFRSSQRLNQNHDIRFIQSVDGAFSQADNMLFGNTLVIFSVKEKIFATTIQSTSIAITYRSLFNMAWRGGKKLY